MFGGLLDELPGIIDDHLLCSMAKCPEDDSKLNNDLLRVVVGIVLSPIICLDELILRLMLGLIVIY